ncbi:MAG: saccharopine dehydrogenase NADP-binding domain-containing protein [Chitinophagales bacterium]|nr:saccharopine dehydrogenase NADP-binding domain-containing protein [Chitinophagales bacterium]
MKTTILVLGGYGGVGRALCHRLLQQFDCKLIIAGRSVSKAENFRLQLLEKYPAACIEVRKADAYDADTLRVAFQGVQLVIVTTTTPDAMPIIAPVAFACGADLMDIMVRADVLQHLDTLRAQIEASGRIAITQCGFHPGLMRPLIELAKAHFETCQEAKVLMAMDAIFEHPESVYEILYEVMENRSLLLEKGRWRNATYKDLVEGNFSMAFGTRECYPLPMPELQGLEAAGDLRNAGVFAAGFGAYIDYFVFPLALLLGKINKRFSLRLCGKLMFNHIKKNLGKTPRVEILVKASGVTKGKTDKYCFQIFAQNGFDFTAAAVSICVAQYLNVQIVRPGLYLMGQIIEAQKVEKQLKDLGYPIVACT